MIRMRRPRYSASLGSTMPSVPLPPRHRPRVIPLHDALNPATSAKATAASLRLTCGGPISLVSVTALTVPAEDIGLLDHSVYG